VKCRGGPAGAKVRECKQTSAKERVIIAAAGTRSRETAVIQGTSVGFPIHSVFAL
jgi:hypothetical protein